MRRYFIALLCAACGLAAAYTITARATGPVTLPNLPGLGYSLSMQYNAGTGCGLYVVVSGNGVTSEIPIGDIPPRCVPADEQQRRIDSLLATYPPPGQAPVTTTVRETTTAVETVTMPAVTVTLPAVTLPAVTLPAVTVEHTATIHDVQTVTVPQIQTVTETVATPVPPTTNDTAALDPAWLTALAVRSQALNDLYSLT